MVMVCWVVETFSTAGTPGAVSDPSAPAPRPAGRWALREMSPLRDAAMVSRVSRTRMTNLLRDGRADGTSGKNGGDVGEELVRGFRHSDPCPASVRSHPERL